MIYPERKALYKEQSKVEKDLKKTILRVIDKYVDFAAANELNNIEDIDYIIDAFNEYTQDENLKINKRSIDAVNRRVDKLYEIRNELDNNVKKIKELEKKIVANIDENDLHIFFNVLTKIKQIKKYHLD